MTRLNPLYRNLHFLFLFFRTIQVIFIYYFFVLRTDLRADFFVLRTDFFVLRADLRADLREDLRADLREDLRADLREDLLTFLGDFLFLWLNPGLGLLSTDRLAPSFINLSEMSEYSSESNVSARSEAIISGRLSKFLSESDNLSFSISIFFNKR